MQFPFGPFSPDAQETAAGILTSADGVMPLVEGYGPAPSLATPVGAMALPAAPHGLISMFQRDGTNVVYAFTETAAYELDNTYAWLNIGSGFSLTSGDDWSLVQFGTKLLSTNTTQGLQQYDIETPAGFSAIADAGSPREIFVCANTIVALDCIDNGGNRDNRLVRTSAIGNQNEWKKTGSDYQNIEDGGRLVGGLDLKNASGLIFQDNALRLIQFGGNTAGMFSLQKLSDGRGSVGRRSIVGLDGVCYWLSTDGFKSFSLNGGIQHIGAGVIDDWFLSRVDQSDLSTVQAALDPLNKLVVWRYRSLSVSSTTVTDDMLVYSWQFNKWVTWTEQTSYLSRIATPGYTLDGMDSFGPLDGIDIPLDSRFWQGGQPVFAALDENFKYATFSGANFAATLETGVSNSPVSGMITWATPIDNASTGTLQLGVKAQLSDTIAWKTGTTKTRPGHTPLRGTGLNIAFRRNIPASARWDYAKGVDHLKAGTGGFR